MPAWLNISMVPMTDAEIALFKARMVTVFTMPPQNDDIDPLYDFFPIVYRTVKAYAIVKWPFQTIRWKVLWYVRLKSIDIAMHIDAQLSYASTAFHMASFAGSKNWPAWDAGGIMLPTSD